MNRPGVAYKAMAGPGELLGATLDGVGASGVASVRAVVATLGKIDGDGDVTVPGFFGRQDVAVVPAHDWSHVPIGKGLLYEQGDQAVADLKVNLAIPRRGLGGRRSSSTWSIRRPCSSGATGSRSRPAGRSRASSVAGRCGS